MGQRALVGKLTAENTVEYIYVHWGGSIDVFNELVTKYDTEELVDELLSRGDSSDLNVNHYEDAPMKEAANMSRFVKEAGRVSFVYSFVFMHGTWALLNNQKQQLAYAE